MNIKSIVEHTLFSTDGSITSHIDYGSKKTEPEVSTKDMLDLSFKEEDSPILTAWEKLTAGSK